MNKLIFKYFSTSTKKINFIKNYSEPLVKLYDFKVFMNNLLKEKIFHYSILNQNVNELVNLQNMSQNHQKILKEIIENYKLDFNQNRSMILNQKTCFTNVSSMTMSYQGFVELLKYLHENREDDVNNIIRDIIEHNFQDEIVNQNLIILRDEWRESFSPEVLDKDANPIVNLNVFDKINLEVNKAILKFMI